MEKVVILSTTLSGFLYLSYNQREINKRNDFKRLTNQHPKYSSCLREIKVFTSKYPNISLENINKSDIDMYNINTCVGIANDFWYQVRLCKQKYGDVPYNESHYKNYEKIVKPLEKL